MDVSRETECFNAPIGRGGVPVVATASTGIGVVGLHLASSIIIRSVIKQVGLVIDVGVGVEVRLQFCWRDEGDWPWPTLCECECAWEAVRGEEGE